MAEQTSGQWNIAEDFAEHTNHDYPVGIYYVDLDRMYMNRVRWHWHEEMEIDLVRSGCASFSVGEEDVILNAEDAIWINRNRIHSIHPLTPETVILSILFHPSYLFENTDSYLADKYYLPLIDSAAFPFVVLTEEDTAGRQVMDCVTTILHANLNKAFGFELVTKSQLCLLWLSLMDNLRRHPLPGGNLQALTDESRVLEAIRFIHNNYTKPLTLNDIAESIPLSKSECCRCFKRTLRMSPFDYLLQYRIYISARMMQKNAPQAESISLLSASIGFNNPSYYNKIFKKYLGCTPTVYREQIKKSHRDSLSPFGLSLARV